MLNTFNDGAPRKRLRVKTPAPARDLPESVAPDSPPIAENPPENERVEEQREFDASTERGGG